ncbi:MAG: hypothetical protein LBC27_02955 [Spirochaetaceae bacterium]|jgi:carbamoyltransferase|nr:hypothetical protein [Spirochaetaceae bacterium]
MSGVVLSIGVTHNTTVGLSIDGDVKCLLSEERICRVKNAWCWPKGAIKYAVDTYLDGDVSKIDKVVFPSIDLFFVGFLNAHNCWEKAKAGSLDYWHEYLKGPNIAKLRSKLGYVMAICGTVFSRDYRLKASVNFEFIIHNASLMLFPKLGKFLNKTRKKKYIRQLENALGVDKNKFIFLHHQSAHNMAALYFIENSKTYLMFSMDGSGDGLSSSVAVWKNGSYKVISSSTDGDSLGALYAGVTGFLGMKPLEHEFKVMGLAPYAYRKDIERIKRFFDELLIMDENGSFKLKTKDYAIWLLEHLTYERFDNIAGAIQLFTEELIVKWISYWIKKTGIKSVTLGGGTFMNVKAAKKVYEIPGLNELFVIPSSGDESLVIGSLYFGNNILSQNTKKITRLYLGREFSDDYIKNYLETIRERYEYEFLPEDEMAVRAARLLADNKIVARCAGREEWGARALGNRSIMCNAKHYKNIDVLNQYIKSRDFWMPFTPSILAEDVNEYIVNPRNMLAPYMCISFDSTEKAREEIPAAIHPKDYTVRPQAVLKEWNPGYYKIISEFKKLTGCGAILNTSFNLHGEPNVGSPEDAIHTLDNSKLEYVILGSFLVHKIAG